MLKVSFNINNIQNTLQRHYHSGQTVLPLEKKYVRRQKWNQKESFLWIPSK